MTKLLQMTWVNDHYEVIVDSTVFLHLDHFLHLVDGLLQHDALPDHLDVKRDGWPTTIALDPELLLRIANDGLVGLDPAKATITPQDECWEESFRKLPGLIARLDQYRSQLPA